MANDSVARRRTYLLVLIIAALVLAAAAFTAGRFVRSPQQAEADARGPGPTTLTVPVEFRVLTSTIVTRALISSSREIEIQASGDSGAPIVTRVDVRAGDEFQPGHVLAEVAGRPVFALAGEAPAYRDLRPGSSGADVQQLQSALAELGIDPGAIDGFYGEGTKRAVEQLYDRLGYEPIAAGPTDSRDLAAASDAVRAAQRALADAADERDRSIAAGADSLAIADARRAADRAQEDFVSVQQQLREVSTRVGPMVPRNEYFFVPAGASRIGTISAAVGKPAESPLMTVASGPLQAVATMAPALASSVVVGQSVQIVSELRGLDGEGVVAGVREQTQSDGAGREYVVEIDPVGYWDPRLWASDVRATIVGASSGAESLVVPVSALFTTADGSVRVRVRDEFGGSRDVSVTVGLTTGGYAAVVSASGDLGAGDQVEIAAGNR